MNENAIKFRLGFFLFRVVDIVMNSKKYKIKFVLFTYI